MANAFECRSDPTSLFAIGPFSNRLLVGAVGVELVALLAFLYAPGLSDALGNGPIGGVLWGPVAITPFLLLAAEEGRKAVGPPPHRTNVTPCKTRPSVPRGDEATRTGPDPGAPSLPISPWAQ